MNVHRRDFLQALGAGALAGCAGALVGCAAPKGPPAALPSSSSSVLSPPPRQGPPRRILILGGTGFIGPAIVAAARARGHTLTLFNRGKTNPGLFPEVEKLQGDRAKGDYESLKGREWDVVIDNPTTFPRWVRQAAEVLKGHTKQFVFVSTISVYADGAKAGITEDQAVAQYKGKDAMAETRETLIADIEIAPAFPLDLIRITFLQDRHTASVRTTLEAIDG